MELPSVTRIYENHHLDSPRWQRFETRPGDILITTAYKSGTTWMQTIVANLLFQNDDIPGPIMEISPWVDMRPNDFGDVQQLTEAQTHRRFLKTHLALDGIPFKSDMSYIYVGRDLRDVFMSMWNHYGNHSELFFDAINNPESLVGEALPRCPDDIKDYWRQWTTKSSFGWERDGYPHWSASHHAQTWWDYRHLPNILFVHHQDLLDDPGGEITRIADFLSIDTSADCLARIVEAVSFKTMKANSENVVGGAEVFWNGGGKRFLNKGTNGRWREVLDEDDLKLYDALKQRTLSDSCAAWLERGRAACPELS
ncbi:MAG: sulfotransferase domain-containing protein [Halioglobus sp.]